METTIDRTVILGEEYTLLCRDYLLKNHEQEIRDILQDPNPSVSKHHAVAVSFLDLLEENMILGTLLAHHPFDLQQYFDDAVVEAQRELMSQLPEEECAFDGLCVKESCHLRMHRLPRCSEMWKPTVTSIRASDINRLLTVSGTVIRTGIMKLIHQRREYRCTKCEHRFHVESDFEQRNEMKMPPECPSSGLSAKSCGALPNKFEQIPGTETCRDYQEVRIQEQVGASASARASGGERACAMRTQGDGVASLVGHPPLTPPLATSRAASRVCHRCIVSPWAPFRAQSRSCCRTTSSTAASRVTTSQWSACCASAGGRSQRTNGRTSSSRSPPSTCACATRSAALIASPRSSPPSFPTFGHAIARILSPHATTCCTIRARRSRACTWSSWRRCSRCSEA